jgi:hypothetical protein
MLVPAAWSFLDWARRTHRLLRPSDAYRPLGAGRWALDVFHINYSLSIPVITVFLAVGSATASLSLASLPLPYLLTTIGAQALLGVTLCYFPSARYPVRFSSLPAGSVPRPPVYIMIEDIVAVNGGGQKEYRQALDARYKASPVFRRMLLVLTWVWGTCSFALGVVLLVLIGAASAPQYLKFKEIVFTLSWSLPWVFAGIGSWLTIRWVQKILNEEKSQVTIGA